MVEYLKRAYTVVEVRTGIVAMSSSAIGIGYGIYQTGDIHILSSISLLISAFCFNLVANVAAEIKGYINDEDPELTGHVGSEGLARGAASLRDAILALIICSGLAIGFGLITLIASQRLILLLIGAIGFVTAITYSLTPIAFARYPLSELISGIMCGLLCTISGVLIYTNINFQSILLGCMTLIMVSFLMAANNTTDYQKDLGKRVTFAHVVGFRCSITILIPQIIVLFILWSIISLSINLVISIIGFICLIYFGIIRWYCKYYHVTENTPNLSKIYGPMPLRLLINFNLIMAIVFTIGGHPWI